MALKKKIKSLPVDVIKQKMQKLRSERMNWETHWQDIADHILPRKNTVIRKQSDGQKRQFILLDNVGMHSNELLAGALHGLLTNPNSEWFELTTGDSQLDMDDEVRKWMQETVRNMHNVLNNSNFQTEIHELYIDLCSFGTACMQMEEDDERYVRFSTKFIADFFIVENNMGYVDQLYREWKWKADQIVAEFGFDNCPKKVQDAFTKMQDEQFCVVHAVYPKSVMGEHDTDMSYVSQYSMPDQRANLRVGEFASFPYLTPRWTKAAGETYGRSPGMNALPELQVLNKMNETMLIGAQKMVDPPLQLPDDGFIMPIITRPGGLNYYRAGSNDQIKPVFANTNVDFGYQAMEDRRKRVRDTYFVDQLQLQQNGPMMTATEVLQRTEEKMRLLGPMLGRQQAELLRPMIDRLYRIMVARGAIKPAPAKIDKRPVDVRYSSLIAKSQRVNEGQSVLRLIQAAAPFIQMNPQTAQNFNGDQAVRILANIYGAPQEVLWGQKDVDAQRAATAKQQQQMQQQMQQQQTLETASQGAKVVSELGE